MNNEFETPGTFSADKNFTSTTTPTNDEVISTINGLIETCKDGQDGFKAAAEGVERSDLKSLFYEFSQQRSQFAGELQTLVQTLGGDPSESGSVSAAIHRGWINIKSAVTGRDEGSILNECERGEDSAKKMYKEALEQSLPSHVMDTVQTQYTSVQSAHDRIKALRDSENSTTDTDNTNTGTATTSY